MSRAANTTRSFFYLANKSSGGKAMGIRNARSQRALADILRSEKQVLIRTWKLPSWATNSPEMSLKDHAEFDSQIAQLVSRGVPLTEALEIASTVVSSGNKDRIDRLRHAVSQGTSFSDACRQVGSFDSVTVAVYQASEKTGDLAGACSQLAHGARRRLSVSGKAATLMIYPAIVLSIAFIAATIMLVLVVPTIGNAMTKSGIEVPLFTQILVSVGNFLREYILYFASSLILIIVGAILFRGTLSKLAIKLTRNAPFVRDVVMQQELTRFFSVISAMTKSGIPLSDAIQVSSAVITHPKLNSDLKKLRQRLIEGGVFRSLISKVEALPLSTRRLLIAADQAGDLESAFDGLALDHAEEVDKKTARLMAILEPLLIVVLFLIVGTIILAIMLPMLNMTSGAM
ncbi:MAG: type II secretion system F family protein [Phycisphaerales bacterium]|nr:type II secretion system F family protein [Phycisphaerales bacterium]